MRDGDAFFVFWWQGLAAERPVQIDTNFAFRDLGERLMRFSLFVLYTITTCQPLL
jgi:hypothetical protein